MPKVQDCQIHWRFSSASAVAKSDLCLGGYEVPPWFGVCIVL